VFDSQGKLDVFEDFRVDRSLPKFQPTELDQAASLGSTHAEEGQMMSHDQFDREQSIRTRRGQRLGTPVRSNSLIMAAQGTGSHPPVRLTRFSSGGVARRALSGGSWSGRLPTPRWNRWPSMVN